MYDQSGRSFYEQSAATTHVLCSECDHYLRKMHSHAMHAATAVNELVEALEVKDFPAVQSLLQEARAVREHLTAVKKEYEQHRRICNL
jgi:hypothetical protein